MSSISNSGYSIIYATAIPLIVFILMIQTVLTFLLTQSYPKLFLLFQDLSKQEPHALCDLFRKKVKNLIFLFLLNI